MGCSESKDCHKISVIPSDQAPPKVPSASSSVTSDMGASASASNSSASSMGSSGKAAGISAISSAISEEEKGLQYEDNIPINDLGESLDARRLRRILPRTFSTQSIPEPVLNKIMLNPSTSSARSAESGDSGIYEFDEEYSFVITENSPHEFVKRVQKEFTPVENIDLTLTGKACPRLLSGSQRIRQEEADVMQSLRDEGFIAHNKQKALGGLAFEIVETDTNAKSAGQKIKPKDFLPEGHRQHLDNQRSKHAAKTVTAEDLDRKQFLADERRRLDMEAKLQKIHLNRPFSTVEQRSNTLLEAKIKKEDAALEKREAHLKDLRNKLQAKNQKIKNLRLKRLLNAPPVPVAIGVGPIIDEGDDFFN